MQPLISVVIPCYNCEETIERALNSILEQSYKNVELICVNNASSDSTVDVLKNFRVKYPSLIIVDEIKKGSFHARNKGLEISQGTWIQFLDADDYLLPDKIAHQVKLLAEEKTSLGFICGNEIYKTNSNPNSQTPYFKFTKDVWTDLITGNLGDTCSNLWNAQAVRSAGSWSHEWKSSQEIELMFRILKLGYLVKYDELALTVIVQQKSGSISKSDPAANYKRYYEIRKSIYSYCVSNGKENISFVSAFVKELYVVMMAIFAYEPNYSLAVLHEWKELINHHSDSLPKRFKTLKGMLGNKGAIRTDALLRRIF